MLVGVKPGHDVLEVDLSQKEACHSPTNTAHHLPAPSQLPASPVAPRLQSYSGAQEKRKTSA